MPLERAVRLLRESAETHFDPHIVEVFIDYLEDNRYQLIKPRALIEESRHRSESSGCRRKAPRIEFHTQVSVRYQKRVMAGDLVDISTKGAYIATPDPVVAGEFATITFSLPGSGQYICVESKIAWSNSDALVQSPNHPRGFAVVFKSLDIESQRMISDFVRCQITSAPKIASNDTLLKGGKTEFLNNSRGVGL